MFHELSSHGVLQIVGSNGLLASEFESDCQFATIPGLPKWSAPRGTGDTRPRRWPLQHPSPQTDGGGRVVRP